MTGSGDDDEDDFLFLDDDEPTGDLDGAASGPLPWVVLVVDDDQDVHAVTRLALDGITFQNRKLEILDSHSGQEARLMLAHRPDIAVVFLDVVMETDDAGLRVARFIRDELSNRKVRIILRTGQPGQAPEQDVIVSYDINDYKSKTELTAQKLFTTLITALRSHGDLIEIETSRDGLRRIGDASAELFRIRVATTFMQRTLDELMTFTGSTSGAIFGREPEQHGQSRVMLPLAMQNWSTDGEAELLSHVETVSDTRQSLRTDQHCLLYLATPDGRELIVYLRYPASLSDTLWGLLDMFIAKIGIGYDNVVMHEWREQTNRWLEEQVSERTRELSEKSTRLETAHRQLADELELAHILQQAILPAGFPNDDSVRLTATMLPARQVGGDFYHMLRLNDGRVAFLIADVSGKGVPAAFFMLRAHALLNHIAATGASPAACLDLANRELCEANPLMLFVTVFFGLFDPKTRHLAYATGGHDMPLRLRPDGLITALPRAGGMLLGTLEEAKFTEASVDLDEGDRLFLFTDGFTEAMNAAGDWFGEARLVESLCKARSLPADDLIKSVVADVQAFAGEHPQYDDITCVLLDAGDGPR